MNRSATIRAFITAALAASLLLVFASPAVAASMTLDPASGPSPTPTTVTVLSEGVGVVTVFVDGESVGPANPLADGSWSLELTIVGSPGQEVVVKSCQADAAGSTCGVTASATFVIDAPTTTTVPPTTTTSTTTTTTTTSTTTTTTTTTTLPPTTTAPPTTAPPTTTAPTTTEVETEVLSETLEATTTTEAAIAAPLAGSDEPGSGTSPEDDPTVAAPPPLPGDDDGLGVAPAVGLGAAALLAIAAVLLLGRAYLERRRVAAGGAPSAGWVWFRNLWPFGGGTATGTTTHEVGDWIGPTDEEGPVFPKVEIDQTATGDGKLNMGEVIPKLEIEQTAAEGKLNMGEVIPKLEIEQTAAGSGGEAPREEVSFSYHKISFDDPSAGAGADISSGEPEPEGFGVEREMKESGEKGGTEDLNIGVGELQEAGAEGAGTDISSGEPEPEGFGVEREMKESGEKGGSSDLASERVARMDADAAPSSPAGGDPDQPIVTGQVYNAPEAGGSVGGIIDDPDAGVQEAPHLAESSIMGETAPPPPPPPADVPTEEVSFNYSKISWDPSSGGAEPSTGQDLSTGAEPSSGMKESGEKGGTTDMNIGVGELQEDGGGGANELTFDDAAGSDSDPSFSEITDNKSTDTAVDDEAGNVTFGDGKHGARPAGENTDPDGYGRVKPQFSTDEQGTGRLGENVGVEESSTTVGERVNRPDFGSGLGDEATQVGDLQPDDSAEPKIPAHTPEWTNFNDADPGITIDDQGLDTPELQSTSGEPGDHGEPHTSTMSDDPTTPPDEAAQHRQTESDFLRERADEAPDADLGVDDGADPNTGGKKGGGAETTWKVEEGEK